jgi:hypothetical protein
MKLEELHSEMVSLVRENLPIFTQIHPGNQSGAINLLHYLAPLRGSTSRAVSRKLGKSRTP